MKGVIVVVPQDAPTTRPLVFSVDCTDPVRPVLVIGGDLDYQTAAPLRDEVERLLAAHPAEVVFDVGDLTFIDSTGLSVLVTAWRAGGEQDVPVRLRAVSPGLAGILDITGIGELLGWPPSPSGRAVAGFDDHREWEQDRV